MELEEKKNVGEEKKKGGVHQRGINSPMMLAPKWRQSWKYRHRALNLFGQLPHHSRARQVAV